jgi:hypothetical protein
MDEPLDRPVQNNGISTMVGGVTGKGWLPGESGNRGGRPRGLSRLVRETVSEDELIKWCLDCLRGVLPDGTRTEVADRRWAVTWLSERGWGKPTAFVVVDDEDAPDQADVDAAVERFRTEVKRLAALQKLAAPRTAVDPAAKRSHTRS